MTFSHGPMPAEEAIRRCEATRGAAGGSLRVEAGLDRALGPLLAVQGGVERARGDMGRGVARLEELGMAAIAAATRGQGMAFVDSLAGDSEAAERALRDSYDQLEEMGEQSFLSTTAAFLAEVLFDRGKIAEAERFTIIAEQAAAET